MMARSLRAPSNRPDTEAQDQLLQINHFRLATRGRSIQKGQELTCADPFSLVERSASGIQQTPNYAMPNTRGLTQPPSHPAARPPARSHALRRRKSLTSRFRSRALSIGVPHSTATVSRPFVFIRSFRPSHFRPSSMLLTSCACGPSGARTRYCFSASTVPGGTVYLLFLSSFPSP
jgi:hypothetical protein